MKVQDQLQKGCLEASHWPIDLDRLWNQAELLEAARRSECRNTGWPIGVVLSSPQDAPHSTTDGIRASIPGDDSRYDYWSLHKRGAFYFLRRFEEDSPTRGTTGSLFFDTRIWRAAEVFLHCAKLYQALDVPATTEINIQISHHGLKGRTLGASRWERAISMSGRKCEEDSQTWQSVVRLGVIEPSLEDLVKTALEPLFILFDFWQPAPQVWKSVVGEFLASRV
jgi:hypothetical protein